MRALVERAEFVEFLVTMSLKNQTNKGGMWPWGSLAIRMSQTTQDIPLSTGSLRTQLLLKFAFACVTILATHPLPNFMAPDPTIVTPGT